MKKPVFKVTPAIAYVVGIAIGIAIGSSDEYLRAGGTKEKVERVAQKASSEVKRFVANIKGKSKERDLN